MLRQFFNEFYTNGYFSQFLELFNILAIILGISVIISKNPIVSVLLLIFLFATVAIYLIMIGFHFIGISYLLVYVGAVSILFLFILMLINIRISELLTETNNSIPLAITTVISFEFIIGQIFPFKQAEFSFMNYIYNSFFEGLYNVQNDEFLAEDKQQLSFVS